MNLSLVFIMSPNRIDFTITIVSIAAEASLSGGRFAAKAIQITRLNRTLKLIKVRSLVHSHYLISNLLAQ